jgi:hypothetical protein
MNIFCPNCSVFIKNIKIFGSIVVSISACHSKEQLAGGRGSIPRQRDITILFFFRVLLGAVVEWWSCGGVGRASAKTGLCVRQFFRVRAIALHGTVKWVLLFFE